MNYIRLLLQLLWRFWFYLNASLVVIIFYPAYFILLQRKAWFPHVFTLYKVCARLMLFNAGIFPKVIHLGKPQNGTPYIICPNHCSYLDIVCTYIAFPRYFHFMGKSELKNIPLFGHFFKEMNISVDRTSIRDSHRAFIRAADDLDKGISVAIFPEATIPEHAPRMKSFKNGAFRLAVEKQVPILPVVYPDNWRLMPDGILRRMRAGRPGRPRVIIHPPVSTLGMKDDEIPLLKNKVYGILETSLEEYTRE
jgi:1-acyl-sn-glycerol-3-phosphate acyltransferase